MGTNVVLLGTNLALLGANLVQLCTDEVLPSTNFGLLGANLVLLTTDLVLLYLALEYYYVLTFQKSRRCVCEKKRFATDLKNLKVLKV